MIYDIILSRENNKYIARAKEWPEVTAIEDSRDAAITKLKSQLLEYLTNKVEVVQIDIPLSIQTKSSWLDRFGWFRDDPTFDDLQSEITSYRRELDQEMGHSME